MRSASSTCRARRFLLSRRARAVCSRPRRRDSFAAHTPPPVDSHRSCPRTSRLHRHLHRAHARRQRSKGIYAARFDTATGRLGAANARRRAGEPVVGRRLARSALPLRRLRGRRPDVAGNADGVRRRVCDRRRRQADAAQSRAVERRGSLPHLAVSRSGRTVAVANYTGRQHGVVQASTPTVTRRRHHGPARRPGPEHGAAGSGARAFRQLRRRRSPAALVRSRRRRASTCIAHDPTRTASITRAQARLRSTSSRDPGPRHLAVHPSARYVYVITELTNSVGVFAWNPGAATLVQRQSISTLPARHHRREHDRRDRGASVAAASSTDPTAATTASRSSPSMRATDVSRALGQHADRRQGAAQLRHRSERPLAPRRESALQRHPLLRDRSAEGNAHADRRDARRRTPGLRPLRPVA